jgi:modulator of FtsH protease
MPVSFPSVRAGFDDCSTCPILEGFLHALTWILDLSPLLSVQRTVAQFVRHLTENVMQDKSLYRVDSIGIEAALGTNKVLKNTYMLLGMTLLFSALTAGISMAVGLGQGTALILSLVGFGLLFVVHKTADSSKGLLAIFAFTGVMGASIGPMLNFYLAMPNGPSLVMQALGGTAVVFFGLSAYALTTRKDFSYMGGFLMVGLLVAVVAMIANIFLHIPALSLTISAAVVMIMSGLILFDTSRIINGGETNYIRATVSLYLDIYNLFIHLLSLLTAFNGDD